LYVTKNAHAVKNVAVVSELMMRGLHPSQYWEM